MLWVLKRIVSMRRFFEHPNHILKLTGNKLITILRKKSVFIWSSDMCALRALIQKIQAGVGLENYLFRNQCISQRTVRTSLEKQLDT